MNICFKTFQPVFRGLKNEAYVIKNYTQQRFKDVTSIIKSDPLFTGTFLLGLAWATYSYTLPVFLIFSITIVVDYLDYTYWSWKYKKASPWSISLFSLFLDFRTQQDYKPLSNQDRGELAADPQLCSLMEKLDGEMLSKQQAHKNDPRPILLILKAKGDHNGALKIYDPAITINGNNNNGVQELKRKYKIEIIENITNINQIKEGLKKIANKIQHVWIHAHGTPTSILLDGNNCINSQNIDDLLNLMQAKLSTNAHVILLSCSTGQKMLLRENIATKFSKFLPGRTIWAPKLPTNCMTLNLGDNFSIKVGFWNKSRLQVLKEIVWNICCLRPFKKIGINVTTKMKDGIECL